VNGGWSSNPGSGQSPGTSRNERSMARVFAIQVQGFVSITSVAVQGLLGAGHKSRYTRFYKKHWSGRGIGITNLSW